MLRRECSLLAAQPGTRAANPLPFWVWCVSHFHQFTYYGTYDDLLALTMPVSPWSLAPFVAWSFGPCVPFYPPGSLLTAEVGGVVDSFTRRQSVEVL